MTKKELEAEINRLAEEAEDEGKLPGKQIVKMLQDEGLLDEDNLDVWVPLSEVDEDRDADAPNYQADEPEEDEEQ